MIKQIRSDTCLKFLTSHHAEREHISLQGIVDKRVVCYGYYLDTKLIATVCIMSFAKKKRIKAFYVDKNYRSSGYAVELIEGVLETGIKYSVFATPFEYASFEHFGFVDKTADEYKVIRYMEGEL